MNTQQLLIFGQVGDEPIEVKIMNECKATKASLDRVRKGQFAKIGALGKRADDHEARLDVIEKGICYTIPREDFDKLVADYQELKAEMQSIREYMHYLSQTVPRELELAYH
jgi:hypothetical protein